MRESTGENFNFRREFNDFNNSALNYGSLDELRKMITRTNGTLRPKPVNDEYHIHAAPGRGTSCLAVVGDLVPTSFVEMVAQLSLVAEISTFEIGSAPETA